MTQYCGVCVEGVAKELKAQSGEDVHFITLDVDFGDICDKCQQAIFTKSVVRYVKLD